MPEPADPVIPESACPHCEGQGMLVIEDARGRRSAVPCVCRGERRSQRVLKQARIPRRYEGCTFDSYHLAVTESLKHAFRAARAFVEGYPLENRGNGLILTGGIGVGKTHLAVAILQGLIEERGASGIFYDYRELLKQVQNSYNPRVEATELEVLKPVFDAQVLVLDEIGASKPTDWVWDTVAHILNTRYNLEWAWATMRRATRGQSCATKPWGIESASACDRACKRCAWSSICRVRTIVKVGNEPHSLARNVTRRS